MKIQILSDLHQEFYANPHLPYFNPEANLILFAGDISTSPYSYKIFLTEIRKKTSAPIVAVLGNHEFYGNNIKSALKEYQAGCQLIPDFYLIENSHVDFNNVRIIGATLWTDYDKGNGILAAIQGMADFDMIEFNRNSTVMDLAEEIVKKHKKSVSYIKNTLKKSNNFKTIVLTHHMPSFSLIHPKYKNSKLNSSFTSNLDNLIIEESPDLWICGHTHTHIDTVLDRTRVIANPLGYQNEYGSSDYIEGLTVEL